MVRFNGTQNHSLLSYFDFFCFSSKPGQKSMASCEATSPTNSCSLLGGAKDFDNSLLSFEGNFSSTRPLEELPDISLPPTSGLQLSAALATASPPSFNAHSIAITPPRPHANSFSPSSLSHFSPGSSTGASEYIDLQSSPIEHSPASSPALETAAAYSSQDDIFILSGYSQADSSARGSISDSLQESCSTPLQSQDTTEQHAAGSIDFQRMLVGENETTEKQKSPTPSDEKLKEVSPASPPKPKPDAVPRNIKLPQRKGGMQLWQFLYALLGNSASSKYGKLIEWTSNGNSREFRLLEPEAIAIWWGEHKSKKNMSYDKLSRSLRYYYDKGIIRKIPGERYVYQFCIDPEVMYKHIGNSDCRPKLKPMPANARRATTDYQLRHGFNPSLLHPKDSMFLSTGPLMMSQNGLPSSYALGGAEISFPPPDYPNYPPSYMESAAYASLSMEMYANTPACLEYSDDIKPHLPLRSQSYMYSNEATDGYNCGSFMPPSSGYPPNVMGPPPLQSITPPHPPSEGNSPQMSSYPQHPQMLDELIEPAGNCELSHPAIVYSPCSEPPYVGGAELETAGQWSAYN